MLRTLCCKLCALDTNPLEWRLIAITMFPYNTVTVQTRGKIIIRSINIELLRNWFAWNRYLGKYHIKLTTATRIKCILRYNIAMFASSAPSASSAQHRTWWVKAVFSTAKQHVFKTYIQTHLKHIVVKRNPHDQLISGHYVAQTNNRRRTALKPPLRLYTDVCSLEYDCTRLHRLCAWGPIAPIPHISFVPTR